MSDSTPKQGNPNQITAPAAESRPTFEESLELLQVAVRKLESGELSLEDSLKCFEEGVRLTRTCQDYLGGAERRIELLTRVTAESGAEFEPFGNGQ